MKRARTWSAPILALSLGAFAAGACGGTTDGGGGASGAAANTSGAGSNSGGAGADTGGAGVTSGGAGASDGGAGANPGAAGSSNAGSGPINGGASSVGGSNPIECDKAECGPQLGLPNWPCEDGSIGGPTGRCIRNSAGSCGWEINNCPRAGVGGAGGASQGGQGNAGTPSTGGATSTDCGGCSSGQICVFQNGGPGPSHFICATQSVCSAPSACACIVGQGLCQPNLMGNPARYCMCENGLD